MSRLPLLIALLLPISAATQTPGDPRLEITVTTGIDNPGTTGEGTVTVSAKVVLPPGWKRSNHTRTVRHAKDSAATTLNFLVPINGPKFKTKVELKSGSYKVWGVIDVKDADGRERQISSPSQNANVQ